jgi:hypothetical protein
MKPVTREMKPITTEMKPVTTVMKPVTVVMKPVSVVINLKAPRINFITVVTGLNIVFIHSNSPVTNTPSLEVERNTCPLITM